MGRAPCCDKANVKRGPWSPEEDATLKNYLEMYGNGGNWIALPHKAGLKRCGKSCRLRWLNYLRPNIKHGGFTDEEDDIILTLFNKMGSRWSVIASQLPGRTDNDVKNHWNTKLKKKLSMFNPSGTAYGSRDRGLFLAQCSENLTPKTSSTSSSDGSLQRYDVEYAGNRCHPWGVLMEMGDLDCGFMASGSPFLPPFYPESALFHSESMSSRDGCNGVSASVEAAAAYGLNLQYQYNSYDEEDGRGLSPDLGVGFRFPHDVIHGLRALSSTADISPLRFLC